MNFLSRSSRPTGPKMRVARGSPWSVMSTAAFSSNRRSEKHTSELQSPCNVDCRLLLEKKTLENLAKMPGMLGVIFREAHNRVQDPAKFSRLSSMIDGETCPFFF